MSEFVRSFNLGKATISIINIGDIYLQMADKMNVPKSEIAGQDNLHGFLEQETIPVLIFHIQLPHTSVLIDAGILDVTSDSEFAISDYVQPPSLMDSLSELSIQPEDIEHVIITHRHWDHFNGTTVERNGEYVPQFPNAKVYLGRPDWDDAQEDLKDPQSLDSRTFGVLHEKGVLELIDGDLEIAKGIEIIATPGETPGHLIVRVHSEGQTLYSLGDLYHHVVEVDHPEWAVSWVWSDSAIIASREAFMKRAISDQALLVATHIIPIGQIQGNGGKVTWES